MTNCPEQLHEKTTYGALQTHLAAVISHARGSEIAKPILIVRQNCFQIIATETLRKNDTVIERLTPHEINNGLVQNRWSLITTSAINFLKDNIKCNHKPMTEKELEQNRQLHSQLTNALGYLHKSNSLKTPHTKNSAETETS